MGGYGGGENQLGVLLTELRKSFMKPFEHKCETAIWQSPKDLYSHV